jgi:hypothetical protein
MTILGECGYVRVSVNVSVRMSSLSLLQPPISHPITDSF